MRDREATNRCRDRKVGVSPLFFMFLNFDLSGTSRRCLRRKFSPAFFKRRRRSNARSVGRSSQRAKFSYPSQAPQKGECRASARQRGTTQVGGSPFSTKLFLNRLSAFLLLPLAQKKSLAKENAVVYFASAEATNAPRVGSAVAF